MYLLNPPPITQTLCTWVMDPSYPQPDECLVGSSSRGWSSLTWVSSSSLEVLPQPGQLDLVLMYATEPLVSLHKVLPCLNLRIAFS